MLKTHRTLVLAVALLVAFSSSRARALEQKDDGLLEPAFFEPGLLSEDFLGESTPRYLEPSENSLVERFPIQSHTIIQSGYDQCSSCETYPDSCDSCTRPAACDDCMSQHGSCCQGGCICQYKSAPCVTCPHVTTVGDQFNINLFGTLNLDMLFNNARPISPGVPFYLSPDSPVGFDQNTVSIHSRQTTLGALFAGPELGKFQVGGLFMAMLLMTQF